MERAGVQLYAICVAVRASVGAMEALSEALCKAAPSLASVTVMRPGQQWRAKMRARGLNEHEVGALFDWAHGYAESNPVTLLEALGVAERRWCDTCRGWCAGCRF